MPSVDVLKAMKSHGIKRSTYIAVKDRIGVKSIKQPGFQGGWMMTIVDTMTPDVDWPGPEHRKPELLGRWSYVKDPPGVKAPNGRIYYSRETIGIAEFAALQGVRVCDVLFWINKKYVIATENQFDFNIKVSDAVRDYGAKVRMSRLERVRKVNRLKARQHAKDWLKENCTYPHKVSGRQITSAIAELNISRRTMEQAKSDLGVVRFKHKGTMAYQIKKKEIEHE